MKLFKDGSGREWIIAVNYSAKQRVQAKTQIDLFNVQVFEDLGKDVGKLIDVICAVCEPQLKEKGITADQFLDSLTGDSLEQAGDALLEEIINFFPQKRRETLRKILATAKTVQDRAAALIDQKLESGEILQSLERHLNPSSGNAPESAASTPANSPSGS